MGPSFSRPAYVLPEELLCIIVSHISNPSDLANLAATSRQLNRIVTESLYRHVPIHIGNSTEDYSNLESFVHGLSLRPQLAHHVRHLTMRGHLGRNGESRLFDEDDPVFRSAVNVFTAIGENEPELVTDYSANTYKHKHALIGLLLQVLPNIQALETTVLGCPGHLIRQITNCRPGALHNLRDIVLVIPDAQKNFLFFWDEYSSLFSLPNLKRVFFHGSGSTVPLKEPDNKDYHQNICTFLRTRRKWKLDMQTYKVEHIELRGVTLSYADMCQMLFACKALRHFSHSLEAQVPFHDISIIQALSCLHWKTLEELSFEETSGVPYHCHWPLEYFRKLQHAKVPASAIQGYIQWRETGDFDLPDNKLQLNDSITKLTIAPDITHRSWKVAADLLKLEPKACPALTDLTIYAADSKQFVHEVLGEVCAEHNIRLHIFEMSEHVGGTIQRGWGIEEDTVWDDLETSKTHTTQYRKMLDD